MVRADTVVPFFRFNIMSGDVDRAAIGEIIPRFFADKKSYFYIDFQVVALCKSKAAFVDVGLANEDAVSLYV